MGYYSDNHHVEDLVLSTINEGTLYEDHKRHGFEKASEDLWFIHVRTRAIPEWNKSGGRHRFTGTETMEAARILKRYYEQHVSEF